MRFHQDWTTAPRGGRWRLFAVLSAGARALRRCGGRQYAGCLPGSSRSAQYRGECLLVEALRESQSWPVTWSTRVGLNFPPPVPRCRSASAFQVSVEASPRFEPIAGHRSAPGGTFFVRPLIDGDKPWELRAEGEPAACSIHKGTHGQPSPVGAAEGSHFGRNCRPEQLSPLGPPVGQSRPPPSSDSR